MTRDILELISESLQLEINRDEVREIERNIESENDFYVEIDGQEYRFIHDAFIWDIYVDGIKEITEECYLINDGAKQWWIAIDWEKTAENCYDADGYGHHFASYDGNEVEWAFDGENYHIFRTN